MCCKFEVGSLLQSKNKKKKKKKKKYIRSQKGLTNQPTASSTIKYVQNDFMKKIIKKCRGVKKCNDGINRTKKEEQRKNFKEMREHDVMMTEEYSIVSKIKETFPNETNNRTRQSLKSLY